MNIETGIDKLLIKMKICGWLMEETENVSREDVNVNANKK
jgi:hypothetical protein